MKFIYPIFLLIILSGTVISAQQTGKIKQIGAADWSALFPIILGCESEIQPLKQIGKLFEQTVIFRREGSKSNKDYTPCGSITLRLEPSARKTAREKSSILNFPSDVPTRVKGFEAYQSSPLCGLDSWRGSTTVYFDENKVLIVDANTGGKEILEFAQNADYGLLRKSLNKIAGERIKQNKKKYSDAQGTDIVKI